MKFLVHLISYLYELHRVHSKYHGAIRPKTGAPAMFPIELERDFALFVKHCELLRIPRTRGHLKSDIQHYVSVKNITFKKLAHDGPGNISINMFYFRFLTVYESLYHRA